MPTKLRPHHLLCIEFYEGKGYSKNFCQNMENVIKTLDKVVLVSGGDDLCVACPNFHDLCTDEYKSGAFDEATLKLTLLKTDIEYDCAFLKETIRREILSKNLLQTVCATCEWYYICEAKAQKYL